MNSFSPLFSKGYTCTGGNSDGIHSSTSRNERIILHERLKKVKFVFLDLRKMRYDLIEIYKFLKGYNKVDVENLKKRTWLQEII